jgi:hypothetical protein
MQKASINSGQREPITKLAAKPNTMIRPTGGITHKKMRKQLSIVVSIS